MPKSQKSGAPFWCRLPDVFYRNLDRYAKEIGVTKEEFLQDAIESHIRGLRLGSAKLGPQIREVSRLNAKAWWDKLTPEEKRARAMKAVAGRQAKRKALPRKQK